MFSSSGTCRTWEAARVPADRPHEHADRDQEGRSGPHRVRRQDPEAPRDPHSASDLESPGPAESSLTKRCGARKLEAGRGRNDESTRRMRERLARLPSAPDLEDERAEDRKPRPHWRTLSPAGSLSSERERRNVDASAEDRVEDERNRGGESLRSRAGSQASPPERDSRPQAVARESSWAGFRRSSRRRARTPRDFRQGSPAVLPGPAARHAPPVTRTRQHALHLALGESHGPASGWRGFTLAGQRAARLPALRPQTGV